MMLTWQTALQAFSTGMAALGVWFLYDLIREFKTFKTEAGRDISSLKKERDDFKITVRNAELTIGFKVQEVKEIQSAFALNVKTAHLEFVRDITAIRALTIDTSDKAKVLNDYMVKSLKIDQHFNSQIKALQQEVGSIKITIGEHILIKNGKKS